MRARLCDIVGQFSGYDSEPNHNTVHGSEADRSCSTALHSLLSNNSRWITAPSLRLRAGPQGKGFKSSLSYRGSPHEAVSIGILASRHIQILGQRPEGVIGEIQAAVEDRCLKGVRLLFVY